PRFLPIRRRRNAAWISVVQRSRHWPSARLPMG
ncbi:hypothetical protein, partial [Mesorhizobium sp.]